jgi:hypothetical protein
VLRNAASDFCGIGRASHLLYRDHAPLAPVFLAPHMQRQITMTQETVARIAAALSASTPARRRGLLRALREQEGSEAVREAERVLYANEISSIYESLEDTMTDETASIITVINKSWAYAIEHPRHYDVAAITQEDCRHDSALRVLDRSVLEDLWWTWHDEDASEEATAEAQARCDAWTSGRSTDGPSGIQIEIQSQTTIVEIISSAVSECHDAWVRSGGQDPDRSVLTAADLQYVAEQVQSAHGRLPTAAEWAEAGWPAVESRYCAETRE